MSNLSYKTISANRATVNKEWVLVDATDQTVGRLSSEIAKILRGKHKPNFTPHVDCGDYVIVINAEKVKFTGKKMQEKKYVFYSGHPGGQKWKTASTLMSKKPEMILEKAIKGMLPGNILGADLFRNLHVYVGSEHKHEAQKPQLIKF